MTYQGGGDVLLIGTDTGEIEKLRAKLEGDFVITTCDEPDRAVEIMERRSIRIAVVLSGVLQERGYDYVRTLRTRFFQEPVQIVVGVVDFAGAKAALDLGADDTFIDLRGKGGAGICVLAAAIRLKSQIRVFGNLDFFMKAAKQEEELSSRILEEHIVLKETLQNVENANQELEETNKKLQRITRYDTLSGLLNRSSLFSAMDSEIERAARTNTRLSGIMIDIDNFKTINDKYGHLHGDRVIAEIGRRLKNMLRKYDLAGRYGGEEFFIILPNSTLHQAYIIAERFRSRMTEDHFTFAGHNVVITASFGIAEHRTSETRDSWISRCDSQLYRAKAAGRNRVSGE